MPVKILLKGHDEAPEVVKVEISSEKNFFLVYEHTCDVFSYENEMKDTPLLQHDEMSDNGKEASKEYGDKYLDSIHKQSEEKDVSKVGLPADQKNTKDSFDPWKPWTDDKASMQYLLTSSKCLSLLVIYKYK